MEDWTSMRIMHEAHQGGLKKLEELNHAVELLYAGRDQEALAAFEAAQGFFEGELQMHFRHEEQALSPVLGNIIGRAGPIDAMLGEHESLWRLIDEFDELVAELKENTGGDRAKRTAAIGRVAKQIVWILGSHIQKEDIMIFPLAEKTLDLAGKREVDDNIRLIEQMYGKKD